MKKIKRGDKKSQEEKRKKVVIFLKLKEGTHERAALEFGLSKSAVDKIWLRFKDKKEEEIDKEIISKKCGIKEGWKLSKKDIEGVKKDMKPEISKELDLKLILWSVSIVQELILNKYKVNLSRWQVSRYLKAWGYLLQKPINMVVEEKSKNFKNWYYEEYLPHIIKDAKKEKAVIYFGDETGMLNKQIEKDNRFKTASRLHSLKTLSAITSKGHQQFVVVRGIINNEKIQKFLELLIDSNNKKIFLITDNSAYRTKQLEKWSSSNSKIELILTPNDKPKVIKPIKIRDENTAFSFLNKNLKRRSSKSAQLAELDKEMEKAIRERDS